MSNAVSTYMPSLHAQSEHVQSTTIESVQLAPPAIECIARAGTASSKKAEAALIDAMDTLRHVRNALQAAERLDHEHEDEEAEAVRRAADAALRHAAGRIDAALDASRTADEALANALRKYGWPPTTLFDRRRPSLPF